MNIENETQQHEVAPQHEDASVPAPRSSSSPSEKEGALPRAAASIVGALAESWAELRTHKLRVILSLIGIGVAVAALTVVVALGEYQKQSYIESSDRWGGRVATLSIGTSSTDGSPIDWEDVDARFARVAERYDFSHTSRFSDGAAMLPVQLPEGVTQIRSRLMDPAYPLIHRLTILEGRWFNSTDRELLAPPVVISEPLWDTLGRVPLSQHPTLSMTGDLAGTYPIVGVTPRDGVWDTENRVDMLLDHYGAKLGHIPGDISLMREIWVPEELAAEIGPVLAMDLRATTPPNQEIHVNRSDWGAQPGFDTQFLIMQLITGGIAGIVLLLGGLSLLNIQLVAMRQRIREIGVRRSFGASGARVFSAVLLESVVATTVAGIAGIALSVAVIQTLIGMGVMFDGMLNSPPFPFGAAVTGLIASVVIGALAGLIPALVALRVKVIDAIRF